MSRKNSTKKRAEKANGTKMKNNQKFLNSIQVPLNNRFELLSDDDDNADKVQNKKGEKIAPVIVTDVEKDMRKFIVDLNVDCEIKITSVGKKIFPKTSEDKAKIIEALNTVKINHFSHPNNENKSFKVLLCGLPEIDTATIIDSMTESHNITPSKVVMFNTAATTKMYLCHFERSVDMAKVNTIKSVYHHIVNWKAYRPKGKGPTQCFKCAMYGHGISNCNRFAVCMLCGENHLTKTCTAVSKLSTNPKYKCFNCAGANLKHNHKANDVNCPFRAKYIATVESARKKSKKKTTRNTVDNAIGDNPHSGIGAFVRAPVPSPLTKSFAEVTTQATRNIARTNPNNNSNATARTDDRSQSQTNTDLWTFSEVAQIMLNSVNELRQCKTKFEQLIVVANLLQNACQ